jgi:hypothetical protein
MTDKLWKWLSFIVHIPNIFYFISALENGRPQLQWLCSIRKVTSPLRSKWCHSTTIICTVSWSNTPFLLSIKPFRSIKRRKQWLIIDGEAILVQFNTNILLLLLLLVLFLPLRLLLWHLLRWARLLLHLLLHLQLYSFTGAEARPQIIITDNPGLSDANC